MSNGAVTRKSVNDFFVGWPMPFHGVDENVFWHIEQHRTRTTGCCNVECLTHCHRNVFGTHDDFVVLGDAACDADGVAFLERIGADCSGCYLSGDAHHWNAVHECVAQRSDHVCCSRTTGDHGNTWTTSYLRITLRHVSGALFVTNQDVANAGLQQRVVCRKDAATGQTKHGFHVFHLESTNESFRSCDHFFAGHLGFPAFRADKALIVPSRR